MMYTIQKTLNNNIAQVIDENKKSFIVFGRGITFGKRVGDRISEGDITQWYFLGKKDFAYFMDIIDNMSPQIIYVSELIINEAKKRLNGKYSTNLLLMIADHLNFAMQRNEEGIVIKNPLEYEIRRLYQNETKVGEKALKIIKQEMDIELPKEEVAMIALHLVNSQIGSNAMQDAMKITVIINDILNIINFHYQINIDESSIAANRFIIHLQYFISKYLDDKQIKEEIYEGLYDFIVDKDPKADKCLKKIINYFYSNKNWIISKNDQIYLLLHISRLINS